MKDNVVPYINNAGTLVIPANSDAKYHYWNGGQHLIETLLEVKAPKEVWEKYTEKPYPGT